MVMAERVARLGLTMAGLVWLCGVGCSAPNVSLKEATRRHFQAITRDPDEAPPTMERVLHDPFGQLERPDTLRLEEARRVAMAGNPDLRAAEARLESARWAIARARAAFLPSLVLSQTHTRTFDTPASTNQLFSDLIPQSTTADFDPNREFSLTTLIELSRQRNSYELGGDHNSFSQHTTALTASWILYDGYVRDAQVLAAKYQHRASAAALVDLERQIIQAVDAAYYRVQLAREQVRIAAADEAFSQEQLEETQKLENAGRAAKVDVENFRLRVLAAQANLSAARGVHDAARVILAELIGLGDAALPDHIELDLLSDESPNLLTLPSTDEWLARAMANRPDVEQLQHLTGAQREQVNMARGLFLPTLAVSGTWGFDRVSNLKYGEDDQASAVGIELRWELYDGGSREARLRQAESGVAEAVARTARLRLAVQSQVRQAIIRIRDRQTEILLRREALETARENRRVIQVGYLAGRDSLVRLNEAQRDYLAAEVELSLARVSLRQAWSDLNAAAAAYRERRPGDAGP